MQAARSLAVSSLVGAAVASMFCAEAAHAQAAAATVPLVAFYSPSRNDFFTTSQPEWTCVINACNNNLGDYVVHGMQGHVFNPDLPQPPGTLPLWHWWSDVRADNFLTTQPAWDPAAGTFRAEGGANYRFVRLAGYVRPATGPNPELNLVSFWNPAALDNAALSTAKEFVLGSARATVGVPASYTRYRTEGQLLPPPADSFNRCSALAAPQFTDSQPWQARANFVDRWPAPLGFFHGDTVRFNAPNDTWRYDYWGNWKHVRGDTFTIATAGSGFPGVGRPPYALMARVTSGRAFVSGQGWFEANQWFRALGLNDAVDSRCVYYEAAGAYAGDLQFMFNDGNLSDNGGGAAMTVRMWF